MNIPTLLTTFRCLAVLIIAGALVWPFGAYQTFALILFILAALTDFLDGYLARAWNQTTAFGRMLDSIADKMLVSVVLVMLCANGAIFGFHAFAAALILTRETAIAGLREHLASKEVVVPASMLAKWKTTVQLVALGVLIAGPLMPFPVVANWAGLVVLWIATAMTVISGAQYVWGTRHNWGTHEG
ncbi:CDP-diacylglycerol--glycerol-3-phosphate 3-phosphatidyltransferase [Acuticoccus yangtzensis]|uniref:CDP-diacylglycerol--glycerol-3-phosphate 3-phosphatidyltransferase n=1 Tax=Acuticoccus yangtzensis TaxID=1443441 RepID=UPI000949723B|nr:CDP-diacylglycerol--glycerol-3-phosphate 3-phosphatidyltransferase [Acuticoccus yangtzensis]ORE92980.1 CDP-diacylglycerol--glycerol-3-phosphate 3-phosphatidyltransferase [Stappia sp. 22II-S9-Z10]